MRKAYHPYKNEKITVASYIKEFGNDKVIPEERARCPVCNQRMNKTAPSTVNTTGHFSHMRGSGFCPTKGAAGAPYRNLPPTAPNREAGVRMKAYFRGNWQIHFSQLDYFVKGLSKKEFFEVLTIANRLRIWEYARLEAFQVPYILATLMDFPPSKSRNGPDRLKIRKKYFRCFFDSNVQSFDELWIEKPEQIQFFRAWYEPPQIGNPHIEGLIDSYSSPLDPEILRKNINVPAFYIEEIQEWINHHYDMT